MEQSVLLSFPGILEADGPGESKTEMEKRREIKKHMARQRRAELLKRQKVGRQLVYSNACFTRYRIDSVVSTDDINDELQVPVLSRHQAGSFRNNLNGSTFDNLPEFKDDPARQWVWIGYIRSNRRNGHGNRIGLYTLAPYAAKAKEQYDALEKQGLIR